MSPPSTSAFVIHTENQWRLLKSGAHAPQLSGNLAFEALPRVLADTLSEPTQQVEWQAQWLLGGADGQQLMLSVSASTHVVQTCQRCLEPVASPVAWVRDFRFVASEAVALEEDDDSEEDLLVHDKAFDLLNLLEDELLMHLPLVPKHNRCEKVLKLSAGEDEIAQAPSASKLAFAKLAQFAEQGKQNGQGDPDK